MTDKLKNGNIANRRGRPKGSVNRTTAIAKDVIAGAADALGGRARLVAWAKEDPLNERAFWSTIYPKLLPVQVQGDPENPLLPAMAPSLQLLAIIGAISKRTE